MSIVKHALSAPCSSNSWYMAPKFPCCCCDDTAGSLALDAGDSVTPTSSFLLESMRRAMYTY